MNFPHKEDKHVQNPKYPIPNWYAGGWNGTEMQLLSAAISLPRDYGASGAARLSVKGLLAHGAVRNTVISYSINARNSPLGRDVVRSCTPVPLPDNHVLDRFAVNGANTVFTILAAGTYLVSYLVSTIGGAVDAPSIFVLMAGTSAFQPARHRTAGRHGC